MRLLSKKAYLVLLLGDIGVLYLSVWVALYLRHFSIPEASLVAVHLVPFSILFVVWFVVYFLSGLYGRYTILFLRSLPNTIFGAQIINAGVAVAFFFILPIFQITPKLVLVIYLFASTILLYVWRVHMYPHLNIRREFGAVLIGTGAELSELAEEINRDPFYPLEFKAILHPELISPNSLKSTLTRLIVSGDADVVVADIENRALDESLEYIYNLSFVKREVTFMDVRDLYEEVFERVPLSLISQRNIPQYTSLARHSFYSVFKRFIDITLTLAMGVASAPLWPVIVFAIKLEDGGKIFYRTRRVGLGGRIITMYKFRTMNGLDMGTDILKSKLSVTKIGKILRRTRLDELPQLWNVLIGEMSFVGPRPEVVDLAKEYKNKIKYYNLRHSVKPGLSGWAQIKHENHPHHQIDFEATKEKLLYDLYYIKKRGIWMDLYITLLTLKTLITKKGS